MSKGTRGRSKGRPHHPTVTIRTGHIHRYKVDCSCGWTGVPLRDEAQAIENFRQHAGDGPKRRGRRGRNHRASEGIRPAAPTPAHLLPPELR